MSQNEIIALESKINLIQHYESIAKDANEKAEVLKNEIKTTMTDNALETITTPNYVIRFIDILSTRFDTKRFKQELGEELYNAFTKQVYSKKFTITQ